MYTFTTIVTITSFIATSFALPRAQPAVEIRQAGLCSSSLGTPLCCDVDILGVANLNCEPPPTVPTTLPEFEDICASVGKIDQCCVLPILGQGLLCAAAS